MTEQASLLDQILSGHNRQLQLLAAAGLVPLPPEELLPIQVALTLSPDAEVAGQASEALGQVAPPQLVNFLQLHAGERELAYFAEHASQSEVLQAIIQRRDVPRQLLVELAPRLSAELQEILVLRQDAILEEPQILVALESNQQLSSYAKRRIWEYREHLLPRDKVPAKAPEEVLAEAEALSEEEVQEALAEAREKVTEAKEKDVMDGLSDGQIRALPVPIRIKLARGASRQLRNVLIRDANLQVALTVLNGNQLSDQEVETIASNRAVAAEVLDEIPRHREWIRKYSIAKALLKNPRTQLAVALRLVPRMALKDLRELARDKNVSDGVRSTALRLYQAKR